MNVENKTGSFYTLGYLLELIIKIWQSGNFFFAKSGKFGLFFPRKILYIYVEIIFWRLKFGKILPKIKPLRFNDE